MSQPPARSIWKAIITNFVNSLRPRQIRGNYVGKDYFGNKYFEIPAQPSIGKRKPSRWFEPPKKTDFMQEMPAEWEAWLRGRRTNVPSEEEVMKNYSLMQMKKKNALVIDAKGGTMTPVEKGMETFPKRPEYEMAPGVKQKKEK